METNSAQPILVSSALIVGLAILALLVVAFVVRRVQRYVEGLAPVTIERRQQLVTLVQVLGWVANVAIIVIGLLTLLATLEINVGPLVASVGVAGLALSLGAQSIIKDYIGGVLILAENQFAIGDVIEVGGVTGTVESITLRATQIRSLDGDLVFISNGDVRQVANKTRDWSKVAVDVGVGYEENLDRALEVLEYSATVFFLDPAWAEDLLESPSVLGVVSLGSSAANVRISAKTKPGKQWEVGRAMRKHLLAACEREGISLPYPRQEVWLHESKSERPVSKGTD
jgi:small conductance mechanosensitive channel